MRRICPACFEMVDGPCGCGGQRSDGRVPDARRLALEAVWSSPRWKEISRRKTAEAIASGEGCVDCGSLEDLVADHVDGFDGPDDPRAFDERGVVARCRVCSGRKDGAKPRRR